MRFRDIVTYSVSNLFKRKLRTVLTVMGVVIGVASIVVMVSLGLGLNRSTMEQLSQYASLTAITVRPKDSYSGTASNTKELLSDELIEEISRMEHVDYVAPMLEINAVAKYGAYTATWMDITGTSLQYLHDQNIDVGQGRLPSEEDDDLELFWGNMIIQNFSTPHGGSYWETGILPDIDPMTDDILYILDSDGYYSQMNGSAGMDTELSSEPPKIPKKHLIKTCGVAAGGPDDYSSYSYSIYCDIDKLIPMLKKEFKNSAIPGQPTSKSGKPYKQIFYSSLAVVCDDMENVEAVDEAIRDMGFTTYNDIEWIRSEQQTMGMIEAVLGGIGAVSLLVAAIGIANTMMMSIYERTKEIGVMKVLGCDIRNIQIMFLVEAGAIGFIGGVIGLVLSFLLSVVINTVAGQSSELGISGNISYIPPWLALAGLAFAVLVGMISGFFPSRRAMKLSPLTAIRNE